MKSSSQIMQRFLSLSLSILLAGGSVYSADPLIDPSPTKKGLLEKEDFSSKRGAAIDPFIPQSDIPNGLVKPQQPSSPPSVKPVPAPSNLPAGDKGPQHVVSPIDSHKIPEVNRPLPQIPKSPISQPQNGPQASPVAHQPPQVKPVAIQPMKEPARNPIPVSPSPNVPNRPAPVSPQPPTAVRQTSPIAPQDFSKASQVRSAVPPNVLSPKPGFQAPQPVRSPVSKPDFVKPQISGMPSLPGRQVTTSPIIKPTVQSGLSNPKPALSSSQVIPGLRNPSPKPDGTQNIKTNPQMAVQKPPVLESSQSNPISPAPKDLSKVPGSNSPVNTAQPKEKEPSKPNADQRTLPTPQVSKPQFDTTVQSNPLNPRPRVESPVPGSQPNSIPVIQAPAPRKSLVSEPQQPTPGSKNPLPASASAPQKLLFTPSNPSVNSIQRSPSTESTVRNDNTDRTKVYENSNSPVLKGPIPVARGDRSPDARQDTRRAVAGSLETVGRPVAQTPGVSGSDQNSTQGNVEKKEPSPSTFSKNLQPLPLQGSSQPALPSAEIQQKLVVGLGLPKNVVDALFSGEAGHISGSKAAAAQDFNKLQAAQAADTPNPVRPEAKSSVQPLADSKPIIAGKVLPQGRATPANAKGQFSRDLKNQQLGLQQLGQFLANSAQDKIIGIIRAVAGTRNDPADLGRAAAVVAALASQGTRGFGMASQALATMAGNGSGGETVGWFLGAYSNTANQGKGIDPTFASRLFDSMTKDNPLAGANVLNAIASHNSLGGGGAAVKLFKRASPIAQESLLKNTALSETVKTQLIS